MSKTQHNIDELFKKGLENFAEQPARDVWRRLSWHMLRSEIAKFNFTNLPLTWTTGTTVVAVITSIAIFVSPFSTENIESPAISDEVLTETRIAPEGSIDEYDKTDLYSSDKSESFMQQHDDIISAPATISQTNAQAAKPDLLPETYSTNIFAETDFTGEIGKIENETSIETQIAEKEMGEVAQLRKLSLPSMGSLSGDISSLTRGIDLVSPDADISGDDDYSIVNERITSTGKIQRMHSLGYSLGYLFRGKYKPPQRELNSQELYKSRKKNNHLSLAVYLLPEVTEYSRLASSSREKSFATGVALSYNTPKHLIQGGIEISYFYDLCDYMVRMATWDSVGYINDVAGFVIDPENPGNIIFETNEVGVWDSISHRSHQQTRNNYTYLQFPVMFGYKAMDYGIFSAYIKAGPNFSLLLNKQEPGLDFYYPGATINAIENYSMPRVKANVQLLVSLGLQIQASEKLGILAEPVYRRYLNTVYDINNNNEKLKNPYSIGFRAGVYYTF
jgi:hypothetical protein